MRAIALWIWICAYLNAAGWMLSALHELNARGYAVTLLLGLAALAVWQKQTAPEFFPGIRRAKLGRRFRRPFPAIFLLVAGLAFLGGVRHAPDNYDALTYRLPRLLNWLAAGHWLWIPTVNERMNYSTTGWEWLATPFFALLRSDRGLFLINLTGFLLMPGLLFSVWRQLGVARRVAWTWMWILPLAYGYATQAGSAGNDLAGAIFCLASVHFGLRARRSGRVSDVWLAGLSAALMTSAKLSNLPLLLPCLVAVWPALPRLRQRPLTSAAIAAIAALISAAPTVALNEIHTGSWTGDPHNSDKLEIKSPTAALLGNGLLLLQQSFMPPALPGAHQVNAWLNAQLPGSWRQTLTEKFPRFNQTQLNELPQEEGAGLGLGVTLLLLSGAVAAAGSAGRNSSKAKIVMPGLLVGFAAWAAALFYMMTMGSETAARLMLPYYPLAAVPILLLPAQNHWLRFRAWRIFAALAALSVLPAIILSPARPLLPVVALSESWAQHHPGSAAARRLATVYATYARRNDSLAPLRDALRGDPQKIGFAAGDNDTDYSLWRPFGWRQVIELQTDDRKSVEVPDDIEWIVVKRAAWPEFSSAPLEEWAARHHAKIMLSVPIVTLVSWGEQDWCLLRIDNN